MANLGNVTPAKQTVKNPFADLKAKVLALEEDFTKFYDKGNAAAGTRVRVGLGHLKTEAQRIRLEVQAEKNKAE